MADITKCINDECHLKDKCFRYTSKPNEIIQAYAMFEPAKTKCSMFLK